MTVKVSRRSILIGGMAVLATALPVPAMALRLHALDSNSDKLNEGEKSMATITTKDGTQIFYKDWGPKDAQPIVFHHGWPLSSDDWDAQMMFFLANSFRVVAHDRRGHGRSSQAATGHDMDHYASDASAGGRASRPEKCDSRRPFDGWWRGSAICREGAQNDSGRHFGRRRRRGQQRGRRAAERRRQGNSREETPEAVALFTQSHDGQKAAAEFLQRL